MKIAVITLSTPNIKCYAVFTAAVKRAYCELHGYDFIGYKNILDKERPPAWSKILAILNHLDQYDWVFWIDADAVITNFKVKIETLIDPNYELIITKTYSPFAKNPWVLNAGVMIVRNSDFMRDFLKRAYELKQYLRHEWWDQRAMIHLYENHEEIRRGVKCIPYALMNKPTSEFKKGDFIIHTLHPGVWWPHIDRADKLLNVLWDIVGIEDVGRMSRFRIMKSFVLSKVLNVFRKARVYSVDFLKKYLKSLVRFFLNLFSD